VYESRRLAEGASVDNPHFYDAFFTQHGDIASNPGHADEVTWRSTTPSQSLPLALLGGGLFGLPTALFLRRRERLRVQGPRPSDSPLECVFPARHTPD
jgi:hypothetical protein